MSCSHWQELYDAPFPCQHLARVDIRFAWIFGTTLMYRERGERPAWIPSHVWGFKATDGRWRQ